MKKILVVTTFNNHFRFFKRLADALKELEFEVHFLTNRYSIIHEAQELKEIVFPIKNVNKEFEIDFSLGSTFEIAANLISSSKANKIARSAYCKVDTLNEKYNYSHIFMWSGVRLIEYVINEFARKQKIPTLFFELGNFPGKLFVDPLGTNARSLLAKQPSVLENFQFNPDRYKNWKDEYIQKSMTDHKVPQSSSVGSVEYAKNLLDLIGFQFNNFIQYEPLLTKEKLIGKYLKKMIRIEYDLIELSREDYIFYPMQVNKDAQLILNSDIGNLAALKIATEAAKKEKKKLLVKPHPAEVELGFIKKVQNLKSTLHFSFVGDNTMQLINNSDSVITINSTVGLQAKLLNKKVITLGNAFYSDFTEEQLAKYIDAYLIDVEFWDNDKIEKSIAEEIINRAKITEVT